MTARPVGDGDGRDGLREALAETLRRVHRQAFVVTAAEEADALLPVVTAWARERAAEELRAAADGLARSGWTTPAADLRSRADDLAADDRTGQR